MKWAAVVVALLPGVSDASAPTIQELKGRCRTGQIATESGGCVTLPQIVTRTKPEFPRFKYDGLVKVHMSAVIDERGRVKDVRAIEPFAPKPYEQAALRAVKRWTYRPAKDADGKPVKVEMKVIVTFSLG